MEKIASDGPKWGQEDFFLLIQTLPTFWAERIWILRLFHFFEFLDPKFLDFQVPRSQNSQISRFPDLQIPKFPDFQVTRFPDAATACGRTLRSQPDPSPNAPKDQIRRKELLLRLTSILPWL